MDAGRMAVLSDPEGAVFCVWQAQNNKGAQVVNEHGSLNFNGLHTRDAEGAKAFYRAVFGWTTLDLPSGVMWTLPGYGDHLEESTPGLRDQMASMDAPEGFIDVVAALDTDCRRRLGHATPLGRHVRRRRRRSHGSTGKGARGRGRRRTIRCPVDEVGGHQGPARSDVRRRPVRPREQGSGGLAVAEWTSTRSPRR